MTNPKVAVLDVSVCIPLVINTQLSPAVNELWGDLNKKGAKIYAPRLWIYEAASTLRRLAFLNQISLEIGRESLSLLLDSNIHFVDENNDLVIAANRWAERLERKVVYDCFYIALAEQLDADFWTSDKRLIDDLKKIDWPNCRELTLD